jgi:Spy/CpxP family protein refolding chaperone
MRITLASLASLVTVFGLAVRPIAAQEPSRGWAADSAAFEHLGLTSDQRDKIKAIREQAEQQNAPLREQLKQVLGGKSFRDLTPAERESLKRQIEPIRKQMMENRHKAHEQVDAILTPDQRKQLEHEMRERRDARRERKGQPT